jgi:predicted metal-binding protein
VTKIGIIRCAVRAEECAGYKCFPAAREKTGSFTGYDDEVEVIGFDTCAGCVLKSPEKTVERAVRLQKMGAEVIHFGNCLVTYCPWLELFKESIAKETGLPIAMRTHP